MKTITENNSKVKFNLFQFAWPLKFLCAFEATRENSSIILALLIALNILTRFSHMIATVNFQSWRRIEQVS